MPYKPTYAYTHRHTHGSTCACGSSGGSKARTAIRSSSPFSTAVATRACSMACQRRSSRLRQKPTMPRICRTGNAGGEEPGMGCKRSPLKRHQLPKEQVNPDCPPSTSDERSVQNESPHSAGFYHRRMSSGCYTGAKHTGFFPLPSCGISMVRRMHQHSLPFLQNFGADSRPLCPAAPLATGYCLLRNQYNPNPHQPLNPITLKAP